MKQYYSVEEYRIYEADGRSLALIDGWAVNEDGSFPVLTLKINSEVRDFRMVRMPQALSGLPEPSSLEITALAPVVLWGISFGALGLALPREWWWFLLILQISNLSGSAGDLYCAWFLARMEGDLLIQDTGVRMRIYKHNPPVEETDP